MSSEDGVDVEAKEDVAVIHGNMQLTADYLVDMFADIKAIKNQVLSHRDLAAELPSAIGDGALSISSTASGDKLDAMDEKLLGLESQTAGLGEKLLDLEKLLQDQAADRQPDDSLVEKLLVLESQTAGLGEKLLGLEKLLQDQAADRQPDDSLVEKLLVLESQTAGLGEKLLGLEKLLQDQAADRQPDDSLVEKLLVLEKQTAGLGEKLVLDLEKLLEDQTSSLDIQVQIVSGAAASMDRKFLCLTSWNGKPIQPTVLEVSAWSDLVEDDVLVESVQRKDVRVGKTLLKVPDSVAGHVFNLKVVLENGVERHVLVAFQAEKEVKEE
jgi:hypothetical protein